MSTPVTSPSPIIAGGAKPHFRFGLRLCVATSATRLSLKPARGEAAADEGVNVMVAHRLVFAVAIAALIASAGCAKRPATASTASAPAPTGVGASTTSSPADSIRPAALQAPPSSSGSPSGSERPAPSQFVDAADLKDVHFDFDKSDIRAEDTVVLEANARWLKTNAGHLVLIEGHCDERGTNDYNVALGDRRARSTRNYLVAQGVAASRIT